MAEKDAPEGARQESEGPSLELPSFGFRRTKRRKDAPPAEPAPTAPEPVDERPAEPVADQPAEVAPPPPAVTAPAPAPPSEAPAAAEAETRAPLVADQAPADTVAPPGPARRARRRPLPRLGAVPAALVAGLVAGLLTVGLVWGSQGACELVRGTSSCGNAGFLLLLAVFVFCGWVGGALLRAFGVSEGGSTSFLAMGLVAVVLLLVLGDHLFAWWMVVAVPVVAMLAYVVSHRVSTAMVEPGGPEMHR